MPIFHDRTRPYYHHTSVKLNDQLEFTIDGRTYFYDGDVDVAFTWEDFGIGRYEYGSRVGYDVAMGAEEVIIEGFYIEGLFHDIGDDDYDVVPADEAKALKEKVLVEMNKLAENDPLNTHLRESCYIEPYED